ncbi:MAG: hypothetical protein ABFS56_01005 [Pseudomonadota bacterium]
MGLFYFAGHGVQYNGESYLIPVDAKRLLKNLDACRNVPSFVRSLYRGELDMPVGLEHLQGGSGALVAYAASLGSISQDNIVAMLARARFLLALRN